MTRARIVVIASAKGSPGCSFIALGLAARLAEAGLATLLVDADSEAGSLSASLDLARTQPPVCLAPLTDSALAGTTVEVSTGLRYLT